jgi:hypothetical protein
VLICRDTARVSWWPLTSVSAVDTRLPVVIDDVPALLLFR